MPSSTPKHPRPSPDVRRYDEAVRAWRQRVPIEKAEWMHMETAAREQAFTVANVAQVRIVAQVWEALDRAITDGTTLDDFRDEVGPALTRAWGGEDPAAVETIFRTNLQTAYSAGRERVMTAPAVKAARPYSRFDAIRDSRTDEECEECEGTILPQDDPWWDTHTPPLHHNCRCLKTALSSSDVEAEGGMDDEGPDVEADDGFGARPSATGADWTPDLHDLPADLRDAYNDKRP